MRIVFSASNNIGGVVIRLFTASPWNHVDVLFDDGTLIGATSEDGVQKTTLQHRLEAYQVRSYKIDRIDLKDEQAARRFAEAQVGKQYDWGGVFGTVFRTDLERRSKWFCSELVAAICAAGGTPLVRMKHHRITPARIDTCPLLIPVQPKVRYKRLWQL